MGSDTDRNPDELAYWRRRVIALVGVLATLGLLIWACTAGGGDSTTTPIHNAGGTASLTPTIPTVLPTVTVTATIKVTVSPEAPERDGDACSLNDLVVTLASTEETYRGSEVPQFRLTVVNTGERACTYDVSPRVLQTRITSGNDRVWSSAHCTPDDETSIQMLRRGVPYIATITWDRKRSEDGCPDNRPTADAGTYVAHLKATGIPPAKQVFRLR